MAAIVIWSTSKKDQIAGLPKLFLQASNLVTGFCFSFKSAPEEKLSPEPVYITTLVFRSSLKDSLIWVNYLRI